ncbi:MAG: TAXI family TRAP transporter solute-binding subunit [Deltaproteobacteria bacterium]|nr:TAXI family TRAP transporter solute-binding subunit [Deltaproteobacteria bacterium]
MRRGTATSHISWVSVAVLILALSFFLGGAAPPKLPRDLVIGTLTPGTTHYLGASGVAKIVGAATPMRVTVEATRGPAVWLPRMVEGTVDLGTFSTIDGYYAARGLPPLYKKPLPWLRTLQAVPIFNTGIIVRKTSNMSTLSDLKGKRIAWGYAGIPASMFNVEAMLRSAGLTSKDLDTRVSVPGFDDGLTAFADGRVDATFAGSPAVARLRELDAAFGIRYLQGDCSAEGKKRVEDFIPGVTMMKQPAGYGVLKEETCILAMYMNLAVSKDMSDDAAYAITKGLWEHMEETHPIHADFKRLWKRENVVVGQSIPYHPGAVRFYKEAGVWAPALEQHQQRMLKELAALEHK